MADAQHGQFTARATPACRDFHGAAIIDAHGREIPITEEMVARALEELAQAWDERFCADVQA